MIVGWLKQLFEKSNQLPDRHDNLEAAHQGSIVRDAEIEQLLRDYTQPILKVAGLAKQNIQVVIINDRSFNAFVMDAHRIFKIGRAHV